MKDYLFDAFLGYDFAMGADAPCSLLFDDEVECPKCGNKFRKDEHKNT